MRLFLINLKICGISRTSHIIPYCKVKVNSIYIVNDAFKSQKEEPASEPQFVTLKGVWVPAQDSYIGGS